jgi:hypothetical protein
VGSQKVGGGGAGALPELDVLKIGKWKMVIFY